MASTELPALCYVRHPIDGRTVIVVRNENGFRDFTPQNANADLDVDRLNTAAGVNKAQAAAMMAGSMFGWDAPAADPKRYDTDGRVKWW